MDIKNASVNDLSSALQRAIGNTQESIEMKKWGGFIVKLQLGGKLENTTISEVYDRLIQLSGEASTPEMKDKVITAFSEVAQLKKLRSEIFEKQSGAWKLATFFHQPIGSHTKRMAGAVDILEKGNETESLNAVRQAFKTAPKNIGEIEKTLVSLFKGGVPAEHLFSTFYRYSESDPKSAKALVRSLIENPEVSKDDLNKLIAFAPKLKGDEFSRERVTGKKIGQEQVQSDLKAKAAQMQKEREALIQAQKEQETQFASQKEQLSRAQKEQQDLIKTQQDTLKQLQQQLKTMSQKPAADEGEIQKLKDQISELKKPNKEQQDLLKQLQNELKDLRNKPVSSPDDKEEIALLKAQIESLKDAMKKPVDQPIYEEPIGPIKPGLRRELLVEDYGVGVADNLKDEINQLGANLFDGDILSLFPLNQQDPASLNKLKSRLENVGGHFQSVLANMGGKSISIAELRKDPENLALLQAYLMSTNPFVKYETMIQKQVNGKFIIKVREMAQPQPVKPVQPVQPVQPQGPVLTVKTDKQVWNEVNAKIKELQNITNRDIGKPSIGIPLQDQLDAFKVFQQTERLEFNKWIAVTHPNISDKLSKAITQEFIDQQETALEARKALLTGQSWIDALQGKKAVVPEEGQIAMRLLEIEQTGYQFMGGDLRKLLPKEVKENQETLKEFLDALNTKTPQIQNDLKVASGNKNIGRNRFDIDPKNAALVKAFIAYLRSDQDLAQSGLVATNVLGTTIKLGVQPGAMQKAGEFVSQQASALGKQAGELYGQAAEGLSDYWLAKTDPAKYKKVLEDRVNGLGKPAFNGDILKLISKDAVDTPEKLEKAVYLVGLAMNKIKPLVSTGQQIDVQQQLVSSPVIGKMLMDGERANQYDTVLKNVNGKVVVQVTDNTAFNLDSEFNAIFSKGKAFLDATVGKEQFMTFMNANNASFTKANYDAMRANIKKVNTPLILSTDRALNTAFFKELSKVQGSNVQGIVSDKKLNGGYAIQKARLLTDAQKIEAAKAQITATIDKYTFNNAQHVFNKFTENLKGVEAWEDRAEVLEKAFSDIRPALREPRYHLGRRQWEYVTGTGERFDKIDASTLPQEFFPAMLSRQVNFTDILTTVKDGVTKVDRVASLADIERNAKTKYLNALLQLATGPLLLEVGLGGPNPGSFMNLLPHTAGGNVNVAPTVDNTNLTANQLETLLRNMEKNIGKLKELSGKNNFALDVQRYILGINLATPQTPIDPNNPAQRARFIQVMKMLSDPNFEANTKKAGLAYMHVDPITGMHQLAHTPGMDKVYPQKDPLYFPVKNPKVV